MDRSSDQRTRPRAIWRLLLAGVLLTALPAPSADAAPKAAVTARAALVIIADSPASQKAVAGLGAKLPEP